MLLKENPNKNNNAPASIENKLNLLKELVSNGNDFLFGFIKADMGYGILYWYIFSNHISENPRTKPKMIFKIRNN